MGGQCHGLCEIAGPGGGVGYALLLLRGASLLGPAVAGATRCRGGVDCVLRIAVAIKAVTVLRRERHVCNPSYAPLTRGVARLEQGP